MGLKMKVATKLDYDDYNEYADFLAAYLRDNVSLSGMHTLDEKNDPHAFFYKLIQEFNNSLE